MLADIYRAGLLNHDWTIAAQIPKYPQRAQKQSVEALDHGRGLVERRTGLSPISMRVRYAVRFGTNVSDDGKQLIHAGAVRSAFNSPFWPFVLATTSVGQEGLDFHQYCQAVVHWNLPANPVDLEQREGRVHRYKGHAIRKNIAERNRAAAFRSTTTDPWEEMFNKAAETKTSDELRDIAPYWVYEGSAQIERYVPHLPPQSGSQATRAPEALDCGLSHGHRPAKTGRSAQILAGPVA